MNKMYKSFGTILITTFLFSCEDKPTPPVIVTTFVTDITTTSANSGGNITSNGGADIVTKGICWNTADNPTIDDHQKVEGGGALTFTSSMLQLLPSTTYYIRAYAINSAGTGYGNSLSFITLGDKPTPTAQNASNIQLSSATINGTVNPNSLETTVTFEYGPSTNYGSTILAQQNPLSGDLDKTVSANLTDLNPGASYHFRIKAENTLGINYSPDMTFTTLGSVPFATLDIAKNLQYNSATIKMSVNPNYFQTTAILEYGTTNGYGNSISITENPLTGKEPVNLNADLSGLTQGTLYHLRIKATNQLGTTISEDFTFTTLAPISDIENNTYNIRTIGTQIWMTENLKTSKYNNGDLIETTIPADLDISAEVAPKYQWAYDGIEENVDIYGRLYTKYVAADSRNVCPTGWHVPASSEFFGLVNYLVENGYNYDYEPTGYQNKLGKAIASKSNWDTQGWEPAAPGFNSATNNSSGFNGLPGGWRDIPENGFSSMNQGTAWWSSTSNEEDLGYAMNIQFFQIPAQVAPHGTRNLGFAIRCVKD